MSFMIRFDPKTLAGWEKRNIHTITIIITNTGCAGHKIKIEENSIGSMDYTINQDGLNISFMKKYLPLIEGSMVTWTGEKWILTSKNINTRCGCGSSFSIKSGDALQDKISQMKLAMKEKKQGMHI